MTIATEAVEVRTRSYRRSPDPRCILVAASFCLAIAGPVAGRNAAVSGSSADAVPQFEPGSLVVVADGTRLTVSTACPQFTFEQMTVGENAVAQPPSGNIGRGDPVEIRFAPLPAGTDAVLDVRLTLQWSPAERVLRKWARFRITGANSLGILREIVLDSIDSPGVASAPASRPGAPTTKRAAGKEGDPQSRPVFLDGLFLGIEFPVASTRTKDGRIILACRPGLRMTPGVWYDSRKAVYGLAAKGHEREEFQRYIAGHRPTPKGLHIDYNSWWTSPVPYSEADIVKLLDVFEQKLYRPYGVSFDTFCIDMGWTNPQSMWEIDKKLFPDGFAKMQRAAARMNTHLGLWISPCNAYTGYPGDMNNGWADAMDYETFKALWPGRDDYRLVCLAGKRYRTALRDRLVEMVTRWGVRQLKFDGYRFDCPEAGHGHAPGALSADAVAEGMISVFDGVRRAAPDVWMETTCFGWNPSPWWLFHVNSVIGTFGDDAPFGRVPAPVHRESYTTARDYYNLQGAARMPIPIVAQEVLGIIHQTPEPYTNDAVISLLRGHAFQPAYINPAYMNDARWKAFADLVKWARRNESVLSETRPLLPKAWDNGRAPEFSREARMPREPYGYAHWTAEGGLVALRNPWIVPAEFAVRLEPPPRRGVADPATTPDSPPPSSMSAVSIYPEVRRYGEGLHGGDTLHVPLAPYETVVLSIGPEDAPKDAPAAAAVIGHRIRTANVTRSLARVQFEGAPATQPFGRDWTSTVGDMTSATQLRLEGSVEIDAPQAELLILLETPKPPTVPICRLWVDGEECPFTLSGSETGWSASLKPKPEFWLFLRAPLARPKQIVRVELLTGEADTSISAWVWAAAPPGTHPAAHPNALPSPELVSLDAAPLCDPTDLRKASPEIVRLPCPIERIDGVFLDTAQLVSASQGWGSLQRNKSVWERPMTIAGKRFVRGLGTHAPAKITYSLDGQYRRFQSWVGADGATSGTVTFEVRLDGQKRWASDLMKRSTAAQRVDVDISGARTLELIVGDGGDGITADHADWADARLIR